MILIPELKSERNRDTSTREMSRFQIFRSSEHLITTA